MTVPSIQKKLERVRPARVTITYDVETGGAMEMKELPFVMGVLGDFSGKPKEPLENLKKRKFADVTPDNFDEVLKSMRPRVAFTVANKLSEGPDVGKLAVDLTFSSLDDFSPDVVAQQVGPLRELLQLRTKLVDMRGSLQGNDKFEEILRASVSDAEKRSKLEAELVKRGEENG